MVAIITGTISPDRRMNQLAVTDTEERLKQYTDALEFLISEKVFSKIVFCDNSAYAVEQLQFLEDLAAGNGIRLELLSFQGDSAQCVRHGKGYGEGEILEYVFSNSELLRNESFFVKITGRLKVVNIREICRRLKTDKIYFNIPNRTIREYYDTRIYAMPVEIFRQFFLSAYSRVWDDRGIYLEKVYTRVLLQNRLTVSNFPQYPRITGIGGSTGLKYEYTEWKCKIKDLVSLLGGYLVHE